MRHTSLAVALILVLFAPVRGHTQDPEPYSLEDVAGMVRGNIPPLQIVELVRQYGGSFSMTPEATARLRAAGADDELIEDLLRLVEAPGPIQFAELEGDVRARTSTDSILAGVRARTLGFTPTEAQLARLAAAGGDGDLIAGLRRAGGLPPVPAFAGAVDAGETARASRTREELREEVYYGDGLVLRLSAGNPSLRWTSGDTEGSTRDATSWGIAIAGPRSGMGLEGEIVSSRGDQQSEFDVYRLGLSVEPFIPLGASRLRFIAGGVVGGFLENASVSIGGSGSGQTSFRSRVVGAAVDGRVGLALHPSNRFFVSLDVTYQSGIALSSWVFDGSGTEIGHETWPDLSSGMRGWGLRVSLGI